MTDWTYIPPKGAEWQPNQKRKPFKPLKERLKHKLEYNQRDDRWKCKVLGCDYALGVHGHAALYGKCPFKAPRTKRVVARGLLMTEGQCEPFTLLSETLPPQGKPTAARKGKQHHGRTDRRRKKSSSKRDPRKH
jgi:hypothetical protein